MRTAKSFMDLYKQLQNRFLPFVIVFFVVILITYSVLYLLDFYPEPKTDSATTEHTADRSVDSSDKAEKAVAQNNTDPYPTKITFDSLDRSITVANPTDRSVAALDEALLGGAVRHPDSADLAEEGNVFILGHSSYLPNVFNKNFQAFNGIQDLSWGDTIRLTTSDKEYIYRVDRVYESPASEVVVPTDIDTAKLTLATCNSFGSKDDRFMVEATLVRSVALVD